MPRPLHWLTTICFVFALFAPLSFLPLTGQVTVDGVPVSLRESWRSGDGPIFFGFGILFPIVGFGFIRRRTWSRFVYVAIHLALAICALRFSVAESMALLVWSALTAWYLFGAAAVTHYFAAESHHGI